MFKITVNVDFSKLTAKIANARQQVPFATALALTKTAHNVKAALVTEMSSVFKAPSSFTLRSLTVTRAEKANLLAQGRRARRRYRKGRDTLACA